MRHCRNSWFGLVMCVVHLPLFAQTSATSPLVESIECRGNTKTSCDFIQDKLRVPTNSSVDDASIQDAQLRLSALSNFESVRVYLEKGFDVGKVRLVVEVAEADAVVMEWGLAGTYNYFGDYGNSNAPESNGGITSHARIGNKKSVRSRQAWVSYLW